MSTDIGISRKQKVFAKLESTAGQLIFPGSKDLIRPAGNAVMNQNPDYIDSEELVDSLDILDQFQGAMPAGEWTVPTYVRPGGVSGTIGSLPQADPLFKSAFGSRSTFGGASHYATGLGGLGASGCVYYKLASTSPSFSLWIETDHFVQGMSGCTVNQITFSLSNEGAITANFTGNGMQMVWAGKDALQEKSTATGNTIKVADADRFSADARIYNETKNDYSPTGTVGYRITNVNSSTNIVTLATAHSAVWATSDVIRGYLPSGTTIGDPVEGKHTQVYINGVAAQIRTTDLTIDVPKQYMTDEVGTSYPEAYMENVRAITSTLNIYFRKEDAKYFAEGYTGNEVPIRFKFGDTSGRRMEIFMKKARLEVPSINFEPPAVALSMPMKALGTSGEDSIELYFR